MKERSHFFFLFLDIYISEFPLKLSTYLFDLLCIYIYIVIDFKDIRVIYDLEARFFSIRMNLFEKLCKKNPLKDR